MESQNPYDILTMEPTPEEVTLIAELKKEIEEHLVSNVNLTEQVHLALKGYADDPQLLLKFVRGRKWNITKALESIKRYADVRFKSYPEMFPDRVPESVKHIIKVGLISVWKKKDNLGRTLFIFRASKWKVSEVTWLEILIAWRYLIDTMMNFPDFLLKGMAVIFDCEGACLDHARQFTISNTFRGINVFWLAYPIKFKGIYYVNAPVFVKPLYFVLRPLLPKKMKDRIIITSGVKELYEGVERESLPESLGGLLVETERHTHTFSFVENDGDGVLDILS